MRAAVQVDARPRASHARYARGVVRATTAAVWLLFGLLFKVCHLLPRHQAIVAAVLGPAWAAPLTIAIGCAEVGMGVWILSARAPRWCITAQTVAILTMNTLEVTYARPLLLTPVGMIAANALLLAAGWWLALTTPAAPPRPRA